MINKQDMITYITTLHKAVPQERILQSEPMKLHTTFAIGGPADVLVLPHSVQELSEAVRLAKIQHLPVTILGGGSNVLVLDGGIRGVVIQLNEMLPTMACHDDVIRVSAGFMMKDVCAFAQQNGLSGIEFACGIPGTLGGAVFMNAGAYGGEMSHVISRVQTVDKAGNIHEYGTADMQFGYRMSTFQTRQEYVVMVDLQLSAGNKATIAATMADLMQRRESKQPLEMHSAGSTFKRPPGYFAGTLIEKTGLKGLTVGGAQVSMKHAGFVVNTGTATAQDILDLIHEVQRRVHEAHGVTLEPEVRIIGEEKAVD